MSVDTQVLPPVTGPMSQPSPLPVTVPVDWAPVPRVNLLPPEILSERRFRQVRLRLGVVVALVTLACAGSSTWAGTSVTGAQDSLARAQAQTLDLQRQQARFAEVPKALAELDAAQVAREGAMRTDVSWYRFLSDLALNTPTDTELSSVSVTMNGRTTTTGAGAAGAAPSAAGAAPTSPLAPAGLGDVKIAGTALRFTDVAAWLDAVSQVHGLAGGGLQSASRQSAVAGGTPQISYSGSAVVTASALSHRYDRKAS